MSWFNALSSVQSLGQQSAKAKRLADLHERRKEHNGQFFTPTNVAAVMWAIAEHAMSAAEASTKGRQRLFRLLDNSCGVGHLLQFAHPDKHALYGCDIDQYCVDELETVCVNAGFSGKFFRKGMERIDFHYLDIALINPAFSVHIEGPTLTPYPCTTFGKFGEHSSALSDEYALYQATVACSIVIALLPWSKASVADQLPVIGDRVCAIYQLPRNAFDEQCANVATGIVVLGESRRRTNIIRDSIQTDKAFTLPSLSWEPTANQPILNSKGENISSPAITTPVTNDPTVRVYRKGRQLKLRFACGAVEAITLNRLMDSPVPQCSGNERHRYPEGVRYTGQGQLDLEIHLAQDNLKQSIDLLLRKLEACGALPVVDVGVWGYLNRRQREIAINLTPFKHWVFDKNGGAADGTFTATCKEKHLINPAQWGSPLIRADSTIEFTRLSNGNLSYTQDGKQYGCDDNHLNRYYTVNTNASGAWMLRHAGRLVAFPTLAQQHESRARALGIHHWLDRAYQFDDLIELSLSPRGGIVSWEMALGKARLALALALMGGKHNLITVEAGLVPEMENELAKLPINANEWKIIRKPSDLAQLCKINIISYERLRSPLYSSTIKFDAALGAKPVVGRAALYSLFKPLLGLSLAEQDISHLAKAVAHLKLSDEKLESLIAALKTGDLSTAITCCTEEQKANSILRQYAACSRTLKKATYAEALAGRIHTAVSDEGQILRNQDSLQSKALWHLRAKKRYILSGTPITNYPRDILPQLNYTLGMGIAEQPYGWHNTFLEQRLINGMHYAKRGVDQFADDFITMEWCTNEFREELTEGAKREIPRIKNVGKFRHTIAPAVKRRLKAEPEVAPYINIPKETRHYENIEWDEHHLAHYIHVADEFAHWYREEKDAVFKGKQLNLVALLARVNAVQMACNFPQHIGMGDNIVRHYKFFYRGGLTSKQRWALEQAEAVAMRGEKCVVYVHNPANAELLSREFMNRTTFKSVTYTGKVNVKGRTNDLNMFRYGDIDVMFATDGVTATGLNIEQASTVIVVDWNWSAAIIEQMIARILRPAQKHQPKVLFAELEGSIDSYMRQMVEFKRSAAIAGLDYGEQDEDVEFLHIDTILGRFVEDLALLRGMKAHELRDRLKSRYAA